MLAQMVAELRSSLPLIGEGCTSGLRFTRYFVVSPARLEAMMESQLSRDLEFRSSSALVRGAWMIQVGIKGP